MEWQGRGGVRGGIEKWWKVPWTGSVTKLLIVEKIGKARYRCKFFGRVHSKWLPKKRENLPEKCFFW